jgi:hypothetical protein
VAVFSKEIRGNAENPLEEAAIQKGMAKFHAEIVVDSVSGAQLWLGPAEF